MTKTAFDRDGILSNDERLTSARKCLGLRAGREHEMNDWEQEFVSDMGEKVANGWCSERQLAKLRDIVEKCA